MFISMRSTCCTTFNNAFAHCFDTFKTFLRFFIFWDTLPYSSPETDSSGSDFGGVGFFFFFIEILVPAEPHNFFKAKKKFWPFGGAREPSKSRKTKPTRQVRNFFFWIFLQFWNRRGSISLKKNYGRWVALESRKNWQKLKNWKKFFFCFTDYESASTFKWKPVWHLVYKTILSSIGQLGGAEKR